MRRVIIGLAGLLAAVFILFGAVGIGALLSLRTTGYNNVVLPGGLVLTTLDAWRGQQAVAVAGAVSNTVERMTPQQRAASIAACYQAASTAMSGNPPVNPVKWKEFYQQLAEDCLARVDKIQ